MNWTHVLLAAYAGAVISVVVGLIRKKNWIGRGGAIVLTIAAIAIWNVIDIHYLRNSAAQTSAQKLDAAMQSLPTYKVLSEQEPQAMEEIRSQVLTMIKEGKTEQQVIDFIQPQVAIIQRKRLQFAPDDMVIAVMKISMEQTAAVQKISDDDCYRFLFPEVKGGINPAKILPHEMLMKRINTDVSMMRSAYGIDKHNVTDEERQNAQKNVQSIMQSLIPKYGQDLSILSAPHNGLGKEKIACELVQDLWNNVMQLPAKEAAGVIRMAMSPEN